PSPPTRASCPATPSSSTPAPAIGKRNGMFTSSCSTSSTPPPTTSSTTTNRGCPANPSRASPTPTTTPWSLSPSAPAWPCIGEGLWIGQPALGEVVRALEDIREANRIGGQTAKRPLAKPFNKWCSILDLNQ